MPKCLYCEYDSSRRDYLLDHIFKAHKDVLKANLKEKYTHVINPAMPIRYDYGDEDLIMCLCCGGLWLKMGSYQKHVLARSQCSTANQMIALEKFIDHKFGTDAHKQDAGRALIMSLQNTITEQKRELSSVRELIKSLLGRITNLENRVYKGGPLVAVTPTVAAPVNTINLPPSEEISDDDDDDDDDDYECDAPDDIQTHGEVCHNYETCKDHVNTFRMAGNERCHLCSKWVCAKCGYKRIVTFEPSGTPKINFRCTPCLKKDCKSP